MLMLNVLTGRIHPVEKTDLERCVAKLTKNSEIDVGRKNDILSETVQDRPLFFVNMLTNSRLFQEPDIDTFGW